MDYKKVFAGKEGESDFIRESLKPTLTDPEQKALLNRKGNALINSGDVEGARRVFLTTGYTDGLVRVGDWYRSHKRPLDALRMYWIAPDHRKAEPILREIAGAIQNLLKKDSSDE
jgi:hypothetical protein